MVASIEAELDRQPDPDRSIVGPDSSVIEARIGSELDTSICATLSPTLRLRQGHAVVGTPSSSNRRSRIRSRQSQTPSRRDDSDAMSTSLIMDGTNIDSPFSVGQSSPAVSLPSTMTSHDLLRQLVGSDEDVDSEASSEYWRSLLDDLDDAPIESDEGTPTGPESEALARVMEQMHQDDISFTIGSGEESDADRTLTLEERPIQSPDTSIRPRRLLFDDESTEDVLSPNKTLKSDSPGPSMKSILDTTLVTQSTPGDDDDNWITRSEAPPSADEVVESIGTDEYYKYRSIDINSQIYFSSLHDLVESTVL